MTQTQPRNLAQSLDLAGLTAELARHADDVDQQRRAPVEGLAALATRGLLGALIPEQYGGLGLSAADLYEAAGAIGAGCGATGLIWGQHLAATAMVSRWGTEHTRALLPAAARGERLFGIGVGHTSKPDGPVQARRGGGRVLYSGAAPWVTGALVMTDALIAAEDRERGETLLAVAAAADLAIGEPYQLDVVTGGVTATVACRDLDLTDMLLAAPADRAQHGVVFTANKSPRDAGFYTGLTRAALALCRQARTFDSSLEPQLARVEQAAESARVAMGEWLALHDYGDVPRPQFWTRYHRTARLMVQAAALAMSAGGSGALRDGATHNRLARESMYYIARIPFRSWVGETATWCEQESGAID